MKNQTEKKEKAIERNNYFKSLSREDKIKHLDDRLGKCKGAKKQREKLSINN